MTEDEIVEKYAKKCMHCTRNTLLPYQYEWTCTACGYDFKKQKKIGYKNKMEKNFINRLKYGEKKMYFHRCI